MPLKRFKKFNQYRHALDKFKARFMCKPFARIAFYDAESMQDEIIALGAGNVTELALEKLIENNDELSCKYSIINCFLWLDSAYALEDIGNMCSAAHTKHVYLKTSFLPWGLK